MDDTIRAGDELEITAVVTNDGDVELDGGTLTLSKGTVEDGDGYTHDGAKATITKLDTGKSCTVKASYTVQLADEAGLNLSASYECGDIRSHNKPAADDVPVVEPLPKAKTVGYCKTKAEFEKVLQALGKSDNKNVGEPVIYVEMETPLEGDTDYLVTVAVNGKTYGLTRPHGGDYLDPRIIYFSLTDGYQVDFVDEAKKQSDADAKCDLSEFTGQAVVTLYKTADQQEGVYPTGLVELKKETLQITNEE